MPSLRIFAIADDAADGASLAQLAALGDHLSGHLEGERFSLTSVVLSAQPRPSSFERQIPALGIESPAIVARSDRFGVDPRAVWQLRGLIREAGPDVVLTLGETAAVDGRLAGVLAGCRRIVASWPSVDFDFLGGGIAQLGRWLARHTEAIVLDTEAERAAAISHGWPAGRLAVVPMAVEPIPKVTPREAVFGPLDIPSDSRVIGVVAPWSPRHRVKEAIWSFDLIRAVRSDVHLVIAGEGPRRGELEAFRDSQDCAGVIHFVGPRELAPDWLAHCDMLWSSDPGPRVAYATWRAAASGVPVIAVDTPAHRAKITSGEMGMLIPVAVRPAAPQATLQLFDDAELRQRIASNAREEFGGRYSGAVTAAGIVAVLAGQS